VNKNHGELRKRAQPGKKPYKRMTYGVINTKIYVKRQNLPTMKAGLPPLLSDSPCHTLQRWDLSEGLKPWPEEDTCLHSFQTLDSDKNFMR
jgi:hypothetical protein